MPAVHSALKVEPVGSQAEPAQGYRSFVAPEHPLVRELVGAGPAAPERALERCVLRIRERFVYRGVPGRLTLDELRARLRSSGGEPVPANCVSLSCLLASCLRASGLPAERVYVALGGVRAYPHFHAWVIVRRQGGFWSIDPSDLQPSEVTGRALWRRYRLFTLFNDLRLVFLEAEKRELVLGRDEAPGVHLVLFGAAEPAVMAALSRPELGAAVERLLLGGDLVASGEDEGRRLREWAACGLLRSDGGRYRAGERLVLIPGGPIEELEGLLGPHLDSYADGVEAASSRLERAWARAGRRGAWSWDDVVHPLVCGMLMDLAVGWRLRREGVALAGDRAAVVWAFEGGSPRGAFGVQWVGSARGGARLGQLWHGGLRRDPPRLTPPLLAEMARAAAADRPAAPSKEWLYLRHLGLARAEDGGAVLAVPAMTGRDAARLWEPLRDGAARLVEEAVKPALEAADRIPWWASGRADPRLRHAVLRRVLEAAAERVLETGLVPPFPAASAAPASWGRWLWAGPGGDAGRADGP